MNFNKRLANGVGLGITSQFFADIIFTILTENIITSDILISDIALYYGAASAGLVAAIMSPRLDKLCLITLSAITFAYINNLISSLNNNEYIIIDTESLVYDIILTYIITISIDKTALNDYYNHYYQRKYQFNPNFDTDKSSLAFLFILTISNLIGFYDLKKVK